MSRGMYRSSSTQSRFECTAHAACWHGVSACQQAPVLELGSGDKQFVPGEDVRLCCVHSQHLAETRLFTTTVSSFTKPC